MTRKLLALSGALPLLGLLQHPPSTTLLIYTLFIVASLYPYAVRAAAARLPGSSSLKFAILIVASGWLVEGLAWAGAYGARSEQPALLHPQLLPDLLLALGFYGGWALAWVLVAQRARFTMWSAWVTSGLIGLLIEQDGRVVQAVARLLLSRPVAACAMALYVVAVYGSLVGIAYPALEFAPQRGVRFGQWIWYPVTVAGTIVCARLFTAVIMFIAGPLGLMPHPRPIWEHPFF